MLTEHYRGVSRHRTHRVVRVTLLLMLLQPLPAFAETLMVGAGARFALPSEAAAAAQSGDLIRILPGIYYDCAVWHRDGLTIEGSGEATRITDRVCQGKAIFVVSGNDVTIRNLTLARARQLDGYGAAIRAEGRNLLLQNLNIENNQDGVFAPSPTGGTLHVEDCIFVGNGAQDTLPPSAAIRVGGLDRLAIRRSVFEAGRGMAAIRSSARLTEIDESRIGAPTHGLTTLEVEGGLRLTNSDIAAVGPTTPAILAQDAQRDAGIVIHHARLTTPGILLHDRSGRPLDVAGNLLPLGSVEVMEDGVAMRWLRRMVRQIHQEIREMHQKMRQALVQIFRQVLA